MAIVSLIVRLLIAATFSVAGITKLADPQGTRQGIRDFGLPTWAIRSVGFAMPLAELAVAALLVPTSTTLWGSSGAVILLLLFIGAISVNLARGRKPSCNCFGQVHSEPIGWSTLIRNCVLAAGASVVFLHGRNGVPLSVVAWTTALSNAESARIFIGTCALVIVVQAWLTLYLLRQKRLLMLRLDALERSSQRTGVATPSARESSGLPIGTPAPAFELQALYRGASLTLDALLVEGRPTVLIFLDPDCGPCLMLLPDILRWDRELASSLTIALISRGSEKANRAKIQEHWFKYVLLQKDREVSAAYRANGTPDAVLIGIDGLIASFVAMGSQEIADLIATNVGTGAQASLPK
jgi:thiol-disulfide isomerase/thioredoxin